jgi:hypothetical protein
LKPCKSTNFDPSVFSLGNDHSKITRPSRTEASKSVVAFGTMRSRETGGPFRPQLAHRMKRGMRKERREILLFEA